MARVYVFYFTKNPKLKKTEQEKNFLGGEGVGGDGWTDKQAHSILPLQLLSSWGHNNA